MKRRLSEMFVAAFTERLPQKVAALFFALVLWAAVRSEEPVERLIPVRVAFQLETDSGDAVPERVPVVSARVVGRARDLVKLASTPPEVRRSVEVRALDTVRLELRPSDVELPAGVQAVVREVRPHWVTVVPVIPGQAAARRRQAQASTAAERRAAAAASAESAAARARDTTLRGGALPAPADSLGATPPPDSAPDSLRRAARRP